MIDHLVRFLTTWCQVLGGSGSELRLELQPPDAPPSAPVTSLALRRAFIDEVAAPPAAGSALRKAPPAARPHVSAPLPRESSSPPPPLALPAALAGGAAGGGGEAGAGSPRGAGERVGVGMSCRKDSEGWFYVTKLVPGGPAHVAGIPLTL